MASSINAITTGVGGIVSTGDNSGNLNLQAGGVTKIAVTSAGVAVTGLSKASLPTGSVLQVLQASYTTAVTNSTTTYADTGLSLSITPSSATSKILVIVNQIFQLDTQVGRYLNTGVQLLRDATVISTGNSDASGSYSSGIGSSTTLSLLSLRIKYPLTWLDSPATTSAVTYKTQFRAGLSGMTAQAQIFSGFEPSTITLMEIAA